MATKKKTNTEDAAEQPVVSSVSTTPKETAKPSLKGAQGEYNGKKYVGKVPFLKHKGIRYSEEEYISNPEVLKELVDGTFNRQGESPFIKEIFEA